MFGFLTTKRRLETRIAQLERGLAEASRRQPIYLGDHIALATLRTGQKIFVDTRDRTMVPHILVDGMWEDWVVQAYVAALRPGMIALDVGASFGCFTLPAGAAVGPAGKVFAVEANPSVARMLAHSANVNGFWHVSVIEAAASNEAGEMMLNIAAEHSGGASVHRRRGGEDFYHYENRPVRAARLDALIPAGTRIDVVKLDIEEGEVHAFEGMGALIDHPRMIFFEYRNASVARFRPPREYLEGISRRGFALHMMSPTGPSPAMSADALIDATGDGIHMLLLRR